MRPLVIALALVGLGAVPGHFGPSSSPGAESRDQKLDFHAPLNANGLTLATLPSGFPVPDLVWDAAAPTANSAPSAVETFTLTGSVGSKGAPFCPGGNFSAVEENDGRCLTTRYFTSNDRYVSSSTTLAAIGTTDRTVCVSFRADSGAAETFLADTSAGATDGWAFDHDPANNRMQFIINDGATSATAQVNNLGALAGAWIFSCAVIDHGGNFKVCNQGANCGTPVAVPNPPNAIDNNSALRIGTQVDGTVGLVGDLVKVWSWPVALSDAQLTTLFHTYSGIATSRGQTGTFTDNAISSCWVDGKIEEFNMHYPRMGCEIAPGDTNAGLGDTGYFGASAETQVILRSRVLTSSWTETGAAVVSGPTTTGTAWRDGRGFYRITDNDAAALEYVSQVRADAAINTGDRMNVCIVAKGDSAQTLDVQVVEATGCGGSTVNLAAQAIDTSWKRYRFTHTVADGACTDFTYRISPADFGDVANVGHADLFVNVYRNTSAGQYCPQYIETAAATVTGENDSLWYLASSVGVPATWVSSGTWRIQWRTVFASPVVPDNGNLVQLDDDTAGPTNYDRFLFRNSGVCESFTGSAVGFLCTTVNPSTTPDQLLTFFVRFDDATDVHTLRVNGASQVTASTALAGPTTIARLRVMTTQSETGAAFGGNIVTDVRIYR